MASNRGQRREGIGRGEEPHSLDAQVHTWPAWRGSARAADQARPREVFTELHQEHHILALSPAFTHEAQALELAQQAPARRGTASEVFGGGRSREERSTRSPRRGGGRRFCLVEMIEGAEASVSAKVAAAETTGVGRRSQVAAAAIRHRQRYSRGERGERGGWAGSVDRPRPEPGRINRA
jgi:hypothetical protein